jgi:putative membrane protein
MWAKFWNAKLEDESMLSPRRVVVAAFLVCLGLLALACESGHASYTQESNVNANRSGSTATQSAQLSGVDRDFIEKAAAGGRHEVELGRLAAQQASSPDVKGFGNRMVQDHSQAGDELMQLTSRLGVSIPTQEDAEFESTMQRLSQLKGSEFDRAYMSEMVEDHNKDANEFANFVSSGTNPDLKAWASKTLSVIRDHQQMAQEIAGKLGTKSMK